MLRRPILAMLLCCACTVTLAAAPVRQEAPAQNPAPVDFNKEFQRGLDALTSGRYDEGIAVYTSLNALQPTNSTLAYNLACGYALKGDPAHALEWLSKAIELGFGNVQRNSDMLEKTDKDLASLRTDERWPKLVERMKELRKEFEAYIATAAVYVPPQLKDAAELPLLVVLHSELGNKDSVIQGPWKAVADACGVALVAPSGRLPVGGLAANGITWIDTLENYAQARFAYEKPVDTALIAFQKEHKVDKSRVFIAGEGYGGVVATTLAVAYPAVYRGVITWNGNIVERLVTAKTKAAAKAGLQIDLFFTEPAGLTAEQRKEALARLDGIQKKLAEWGFVGEVRLVAAGDASQREVCAKALAAMLAAPRPASAPAPTPAPAPVQPPTGGGEH